MKQMPEARSLLNDAFNARWKADMGDDYYGNLSQRSLCLFMASRHLPEIAGGLADKAIEGIAADLTQESTTRSPPPTQSSR